MGANCVFQGTFWVQHFFEDPIIIEMLKSICALLLSFFRQMLMTWHKISGFDSQNPRILGHLLFVENNESLFTHLDKVQVKSLSQHYCVAKLDEDGR